MSADTNTHYTNNAYNPNEEPPSSVHPGGVVVAVQPGFQQQPVQYIPSPQVVQPRAAGAGHGGGPQNGRMSRAPVFMAQPQAVVGVPPGLEYLTQIDQLLVHQQIEIFEMLTGFETCNKYQIKNTLGQQVYFAGEESSFCARQCCGPSRGFIIHITDNLGQEIIRVTRDFKCCAGYSCCACSGCCSLEIKVEAPVGQVIGYVKQQQSCLAPRWHVEDSQGQTTFAIHGPSCVCAYVFCKICCASDQNFTVMSPDGVHQIGKITKQWSGAYREFLTDADNFSVTFPMDLDVRMKAILLGAVFLIDFMYFETSQNNDNVYLF